MVIREGVVIEITVPAALRLDQELTPSAKLVWMLCPLHAQASPPPASRVAIQSGLTPDTVRAGLARVAALPVPPGPAAILPGSLLTAPKLTPAAKVLYGILQSENGEFTILRCAAAGSPPCASPCAIRSLPVSSTTEPHTSARPSKRPTSKPVTWVLVGICALRNIPVVIIHSEDLSLAAMRAKIGRLLPLRDLRGHEPLIAFLERKARRYREEGAPPL